MTVKTFDDNPFVILYRNKMGKPLLGESLMCARETFAFFNLVDVKKVIAS